MRRLLGDWPFIDEIDSLVPSRRKNCSTIMLRVVSEFLSQIDGLDTERPARPDRFCLLMGATNWLKAMDEAILSPGRFDVLIFAGLPDEDTRK